MKVSLVTALLALIAGDAAAATTARYVSQDGASKVTIEINDNGAVRMEMSSNPGVHFLFRSDDDYVIVPTPSADVADRWSDLQSAYEKVSREVFPNLHRMRPVASDASQPFYIQAGTVSVHGRKGTAYYSPGQARGTDRDQRLGINQGVIPDQGYELVVSQDPTLADIGKAMARSDRITNGLSLATMGFIPAKIEQKYRILETGTPLRHGHMELVSVTHEAVPASRFELPGALETPEQILSRIRASSTNRSVRAF